MPYNECCPAPLFRIEFGSVLIFCGATRFRTEVLPTTVYLELGVGNLEAAVGVSLLLVLVAAAALLLVRQRDAGA